MKFCLTVNGKVFEADIEPNVLLSDYLRQNLRLTGTHVGCDTSQCGACTVLMSGHPVKSCSMLAVQARGEDITTIEGLADGRQLHPMQESFRDHHALQCGFCTPGMVMSGIAIRKRHTSPSEATVRHELEGNLCRCTGYQNIVSAIIHAKM